MRISSVFREVRANLRSPVVLAIWGFLSVMMALAGPFGSYREVSLLPRFGFWLAMIALCIVMGTFLAAMFRRITGLRGFWPTAPLIAVVVSATLVGPLSLTADAIGDMTRLLPPSTVEIAVFLFCMSLGFCAIRNALEEFSVARPVSNGPASVDSVGPAETLPRLTDRLPLDQRGHVHRVSGRDHYVEVATEKGIANLLMRFSDALAELDGCDGLQVHRSHWVAAEAVAGVVREGGRVFLRLSCGVMVPVSRTYMAAVEARGWLARA